RAYRDSVRMREEAVLSERWQIAFEARSLRPGIAISHLHVFMPEEFSDSSIVLAGETAALHVGLQTGGERRALRVHLQILRLDGWMVVDETRELTSFVQDMADGRELDFAIMMRPVVLGPGLYRAVIELLEHDTVLAVRSQPFRVVAKAVPTGGQPVLLYPSTVCVARIG
ncbi:MAG: hypothetical protein ACT4OO_13910, partial [Nitrospiraceae bacterium]